jgi:CRP-like cAMP-binding protein
MRTLRWILEGHPFFDTLRPEYLDLLTGCATNARFQAGDYLLREGEEAGRFYLLRQGRVALETQAPPRGALTIETLEGGDVLGWSWLFPPYRWHYSGRAVEPVRAIALDGQCLRGRCEADHDLGYELMRRFAQVMLQRLQATRFQLLDVYGTGTRGVS